MRRPGRPLDIEPQFDRLVADIMAAKAKWHEGKKEEARLRLKNIASIAYAESVEKTSTSMVAE